MSYQLLQPPRVTLIFREMSNQELREYNEWFLRGMSGRIEVLATAVRATPGYEHWVPDGSPDSLDRLGEWLAAQVETRPRTQDELDHLRSRSTFSTDVFADWELTNRTFSLAMDIGMYVSQVFLGNHPSLKWSQPLGSKRYIDYGQPCLVGFAHKDTFNPVRMMVVLAYAFATGSQSGTRLRELYGIWSAKVVSQPAAGQQGAAT